MSSERSALVSNLFIRTYCLIWATCRARQVRTAQSRPKNISFVSLRIKKGGYQGKICR